ncbi:hypothetical protein SNK19_05085 [Ralstonia pseudosolanacearum]|uniref:hypothetical protein n=1 Tax=Ralstonia solanacearum species complex TaxID=3116862 RepID=UPI001147A77E|nr:hypothetical protein [Ralstonia pseudosolanacearum]MCK4121811.1 hypothetical protein [Ralstonia pseudosolanacearum]
MPPRYQPTGNKPVVKSADALADSQRYCIADMHISRASGPPFGGYDNRFQPILRNRIVKNTHAPQQREKPSMAVFRGFPDDLTIHTDRIKGNKAHFTIFDFSDPIIRLQKPASPKCGFIGLYVDFLCYARASVDEERARDAPRFA